jgi:hypothetical protein
LAFHSGREADHSPPSSAELYLHSPHTTSWRGALFVVGGAHPTSCMEEPKKTT